ncbi:MAG: hypothetical protein K5892_03035 [Acholeplasmatales bacterium]|nr:hypothetical protein [Acholeplasmatales bacterium]
MEKYWNMLLNGEYSDVRTEVKKLIEEQSDNYELWYLLFLSSNHNYLNFKPNNISNELALNKAKQYASIKEEAIISAEYQLYSNIYDLRGFDFVFRYYQFGKYKECLAKLIEIINDQRLHVNTDKISDSLELIFAKTDSLLSVNLQILIINALYIKTGSEQFEIMFNEKLKNPLYVTSSILGLKELCPNSYELKKILNSSRVFGNKKTEMEKEIIALKKDLDEKEKVIKDNENDFNKQKVTNYSYNEFNKQKSQNSYESNVIYEKKNDRGRFNNNRVHEDATKDLVLGLIFSFFCTPFIGLVFFISGSSKSGSGSYACKVLTALYIVLFILIILFIFIVLAIGMGV